MYTLLTPIREVQLPLSQLRAHFSVDKVNPEALVSEYECEEWLAYFRGEEKVNKRVIECVVERLLLDTRTQDDVPTPPTELKLRPTLLPTSHTIQCTDGSFTHWTTALTRHFGYCRDFIETYGDEPIPVAATMKEVQTVVDAVYSRVKEEAVPCNLCCLGYLSPIRNSFFALFRFKYADDVTVASKLTQLSCALTEEERQALKNRYAQTLPDNGTTHDILFTLPQVREDPDLLVALYMDEYPTWLLITLANMKYEGQSVGRQLAALVTTANFSIDQRYYGVSLSFIVGVLTGVLEDNSGTFTWPEIARVLAMLDIRSSYLKNEHMEVVPPYGARRSHMDLFYWNEPYQMVVNIGRAYPGVWKPEYFYAPAFSSSYLHMYKVDSLSVHNE